MRILSFMQNIIANTKKECEMRKVLPYNVKKAYLMMLLALGIAPTFTSCEKDDQDPTHNTTYTININTTLTSDQVQASADSNQVRNVILKADGSSWHGVSSAVIRERFFNKMFALSPKVQGAGNLKDLTITLDTDSLWFVQKGYTVNQKTK